MGPDERLVEKAAAAGLGRADSFRQLPLGRRNDLAQLLDQFSRPLSPRELDEAFRRVGFTRTQRKAFTLALKGLSIIAVVRDVAG